MDKQNRISELGEEIGRMLRPAEPSTREVFVDHSPFARAIVQGMNEAREALVEQNTQANLALRSMIEDFVDAARETNVEIDFDPLVRSLEALTTRQLVVDNSAQVAALAGAVAEVVSAIAKGTEEMNARLERIEQVLQATKRVRYDSQGRVAQVEVVN